MNKAQIILIKERLDKYNVYNGYKIEFDTLYNELEQILVIGLIITMSDLILNDKERIEILTETIKRFLNFYEQDIQPLKL